ncbi:MAG: LolA family protein [Tepidiformaceae bacterium]
MTRHRAAALVPIVIAFALVLVAAGWWLSRDDDDDYPDSFYIEVALTVLDESATIGTTLPPDESELTQSLVRYWYRDSSHVRVEIEAIAPGSVGPVFVVVLEDDQIASYDPETNTFQRGPFPTEGRPDDLPWLPFTSALVGPAPGRTEAGLLEFLRERAGDDGYVEVLGEDTVLGRTVTIIEFAPTGMEQTNDEPPQGVGVGRLWFDPQSGLVLKAELDAGSLAQYTAEVRELRLPDDPPDSTFEFTPPPGAVEATPAP